MSKNPKKIIMIISGGVGKNIMATAVVNSLKETYPNSKIIIVTPHIFIWQNNPDIFEVRNLIADHNIYKDHVFYDGTLILGQDPYLTEDFIYKRKHLIEIWCDLFKIKYNTTLPKLYFTEQEKNNVKSKLPIDKPLFFIQAFGGPAEQEVPISWMRDLPIKTAEKIVKEMNLSGYRTIQLRRNNQYGLEGADYYPMSLRESLCAIEFSEKRLFIDSVAQHGSIALDKKSTVCWIGNEPRVFGYEKNINIKAKADLEFRHNLHNYLEHWNIRGIPEECPFDTNELFDIDEILKSLRD